MFILYTEFYLLKNGLILLAENTQKIYNSWDRENDPQLASALWTNLIQTLQHNKVGTPTHIYIGLAKSHIDQSNSLVMLHKPNSMLSKCYLLSNP